MNENPSRSTDYHDYVIKDGRFIGAFEEMYRNCPDPWHQDEHEPLVEDAVLPLLSRYSPVPTTKGFVVATGVY